jgi:hypothetical protein
MILFVNGRSMKTSKDKNNNNENNNINNINNIIIIIIVKSARSLSGCATGGRLRVAVLFFWCMDINVNGDAATSLPKPVLAVKYC